MLVKIDIFVLYDKQILNLFEGCKLSAFGFEGFDFVLLDKFKQRGAERHLIGVSQGVNRNNGVGNVENACSILAFLRKNPKQRHLNAVVALAGERSVSHHIGTICLDFLFQGKVLVSVVHKFLKLKRSHKGCDIFPKGIFSQNLTRVLLLEVYDFFLYTIQVQLSLSLVIYLYTLLLNG